MKKLTLILALADAQAVLGVAQKPAAVVINPAERVAFLLQVRVAERKWLIEN